MNTGIIASRYAAALLKLVDETGAGEVVVDQAAKLGRALDTMPELRRAVGDSKAVSSDQKIALFEAVLTGVPGSMAPELRKLLELLARNGRLSETRLVLNSFVSMYYKSRGIVRGRLILPHSPDSGKAGCEDLESSLKELIGSRTGKKLLLTTEVDESLIGGFILEVEDQMLDASVSHQLELIKRQFIEKNRRIV